MNADDSLVGLTIAGFQERLADGSLTSTALVDWYLERIASLDGHVNAVLEINEEARQTAAMMDLEWEPDFNRGPLHGVPILVKDNIEIGGQCNTAGSLALDGYRPAWDAPIVGRLRLAGAVILGKTNLSEWANFRSRYSSSGWSSRGGQTRNPYSLDRTPAGSSSGSGVAVAADFCLAAIGTETDGSIVSPAAINGVVGIKPTLGLVSRSRIVPIAHSQDTAGPLARSVADAATLLSAMIGKDPADPITELAQTVTSADFAGGFDPAALKGARIGVVSDLFGFSPKADAVIERSLSLLSSLGAEIVEPASLGNVDEMRVHENEVLAFEFKADLNAFLASRDPAPTIGSLEALIEFNEEFREKVMPVFGQDRLIGAQAKADLSSPAYVHALNESRRLAREAGIDRVMATHGLDALVAPTNGPARVIDLVNGDGGAWGKTSAPAAVAGYPHVTVTAGYVSGLPIGLSLFGRAKSDLRIIELAHAFEQASEPRRAPAFKPNV
ncbi:MAG: amidase [Gammaproteobacteria bacterium]